jgi:hypothetical protein
LLADLEDVFTEVRSWERIVEKKPGVFYVRSRPFLHFHLLHGGRRRADIKGSGDWVQVDLPMPLPVAVRRAFLRELRARFAEK